MRERLLLYLCCFTIQASANDEVLDGLTFQQLLEIGIPVVQVDTNEGEEPTYEIADAPDGCWGGSIKNATKVPGRVVVQDLNGIIYDSGEYVSKQSGMTIKVRGNWSARRPKKPYKIKLQKKADMLGRGDESFNDKDWLLMPFFQMNYMIGLKVNELMGLQWTPQFRFVNVVFNGEYRGLYMLMESVERNADCRLNVDKNTGYIVELDAYWWNEDVYVLSSFEEPMNYTFKYPDSDDLTEDQKLHIQDVLYAAEQSMLENNYQDKIDVESFARWMLAHEILGNKDGAGSNIFLTKYDNSPQSLLKMGPLWDFDVIMQCNEWSAYHDRYYFRRLFNCDDKFFLNRYIELWQEQKDKVFDGLMQYLDSYMESEERLAVDTSISLNNERWGESMGRLSLSESFIDQAKLYFNNRKIWLEEAINNINTSVKDIKVDKSYAESIIYNLSGQRCLPMQKKGVYIVNGCKVVIK